jgi:hypothetical protein
MRVLTRVCVIGAVLLLAACASAPRADKMDPAASEKAVKQRVDLLLSRYSRNDQVGVVAMLDPERFMMLGTNFDERMSSPSQLRSQMDRDFSTWRSVAFTDVRDMDVRVGSDLATAVFTITFAAGSGPSLPVRLCTTWHKVNGEWMLTQSASAIPPQG